MLVLVCVQRVLRAATRRRPRRVRRATHAPPAHSPPRLQQGVAHGARAWLGRAQRRRVRRCLTASAVPALPALAGLVSTTAVHAPLCCCASRGSGSRASPRCRRTASARRTWRNVLQASTRRWHPPLQAIGPARPTLRAMLRQNMRPRRLGRRGIESAAPARRDTRVTAAPTPHLAEPDATHRQARARAPIARPGGTRKRAAHRARRAKPDPLRQP